MNEKIEGTEEVVADDSKKIMQRSMILLIFTLIVAVAAAFIYAFQIKVVKLHGQWSVMQRVSEKTIVECLDADTIVMKEAEVTTEHSIEALGMKARIGGISKTYLKIVPCVNMDELNISYEENLLKEGLQKLNEGRSANEMPKLENVNGTMTVTEGRKGNYLNVDALAEGMMASLAQENYEICLDDYYESNETEIEAYREVLEAEKAKLDDFKIVYQNGFEITGKDFAKYIVIKDNRIVFDDTLKSDCFKELDEKMEEGLESYDTVGKPWNFTTTGGEQIIVAGGTYGDIFDSDAETEYIISKFKVFESESDRIPLMSQDFPDMISGTYVEVSIAAQHLWFYKNGELALESDVVTGTLGTHDTPRGVYYVSEKIPGKYLTGEDYRTWVDRWMRLNNRGIGLHDLRRTAYGGNVYTYNGSHGCVNLPMNVAYELYDLIRRKDCVVIY